MARNSAVSKENDITFPKSSYGILEQTEHADPSDGIVEQIKRLGYALLDSGYSAQHLDVISEEFEKTRRAYVKEWGEDYLRQTDEFHTIRAMLSHGSATFLNLAMNDKLHDVVGKLIAGQYVLNQQNGVINPPQENYNQGSWHRDLPYQHFVSDRPLAINALFCVDDFTSENGPTCVIPASHKMGAFPSEKFKDTHAIQVKAKRGHYIILDCMAFHSGSPNYSNAERRAVNHVFTIPYIRQQVCFPNIMDGTHLTDRQKAILGFNLPKNESIGHYFKDRDARS